MDEQPRITRRWYQFKLSTILLLVGILAWAMALRPWMTYDFQSYSPVADNPGAGIDFSWYAEGGAYRYEGFYVWAWTIHRSPRSLDGLHLIAGPNEVAWPALALIAFLTWKLGWAVVARRKRRREGAA